MPTYRYVGPYDSADIPLLRLTVLQGETFDVPDDLAVGRIAEITAVVVAHARI